MSADRDQAHRLAEERRELRRAGDYAGADALRERIRAHGFLVEDTADGFSLRELPPPSPAERLRLEDVPSVLDAAPDRDWTLHWVAEGWPEDVLRGIASFREHQGERSVQHVVVEAAEAEATWPEDVEVLSMREGLGWARCRNAGLPRSRGRLVAVVDGSVEATGDVLGPLEATLADPAVGITGPVGAVWSYPHDFHPRESGRVDAVEGYLMAFRREILLRGVVFDRAFRFYRTADVDFSFQVLAMGLTAVVTEVPVKRHEHRAWFSTPPEERARLSKRNFYRFLDRWRGRDDLTVGERSAD